MNRELILKSLQVFFVRGFGAAAAFLLTLAVTNTATSYDAGLFLFSLAIVNVLANIILVGSPQVIIKIVGRYTDNNWKKINHHLFVIFRTVFFFGFILFISLNMFSEYIADVVFNKPDLSRFFGMISLSVFLFSGLQLVSSALQGKQCGVIASFVQNAVMPLCFILGIFLTFYSVDYVSIDLLFDYYALSLLIAFLLAIYFWYKDDRSFFSYKKGFPVELRNSLYPLFIVSCMTLCVQWSGQFATARYLDVNQIAYFSAAQRTALLSGFVLIAVNLVVAPKFANAFLKNRSDEVNKLSLYSSRLMILMASPVLLCMMVFPEYLMRLFGEEYVLAAPLLQIMAVGQFVNVVTGSVGYLLVMSSNEKDFRNVVLLSGPLAIALAFVLTKEYGLIGAAYATAISVSTQNILAVIMVKKRLGFNTLNIFRKI